MNQVFRSPELSPTTQAAEGLMRRRWSVAEIGALCRAGIIGEDERFELIGGEIVPMNAKGIRHEVIKVALVLHFARTMPASILFAPETTFRLSDDTFVEPDFVFYRKSDGLAALAPKTALLAIEVADSSLAWDLGRKVRLYSTFWIPELWVIDVAASVTRVHRRPGMDGYTEIRGVPFDQEIVADRIPGLAVTVSTLEKV